MNPFEVFIQAGFTLWLGMGVFSGLCAVIMPLVELVDLYRKDTNKNVLSQV